MFPSIAGVFGPGSGGMGKRWADMSSAGILGLGSGVKGRRADPILFWGCWNQMALGRKQEKNFITFIVC